MSTVDPVPLVPADLSTVTVKALAEFLHAPELMDVPATKKQLQEALGGATEWAESVVGPIGNAAATYRVRPTGGRFLVLDDTRLVEVRSVVDPYGATVPLWTPGVDLEAGVLEFARELRRGTYLVTAVTRETGYAIALAVKIVASHLYEIHRGANAVGVREMIANPVGEGQPSGRGWAVPRRAEQLVAPFRRGT